MDHSVGVCKAEIFKSKRFVGIGAEDEANTVRSGSIAQSDIKSFKLIETAGASDFAASKQLTIGIVIMYLHGAGLVVSVGDAEF